jgi:hypothetical protein
VMVVRLPEETASTAQPEKGNGGRHRGAANRAG